MWYRQTVITVSLSRLRVISVTAGRRYCWWPTFPDASLSFSHTVPLLLSLSFQVFFFFFKSCTPFPLSSPLLAHRGASVSLRLQFSLIHFHIRQLIHYETSSRCLPDAATLTLFLTCFFLPSVIATPYYPQGNLSSFWWQVAPPLPHPHPFWSVP